MDTTLQRQTDIAIIEEQIQAIDAHIAALKFDRLAILRSDPEYADYLDNYSAHYDDEPLTIREYYMYMARLETLNKAAMQELEDTGTISAKTLNQIAPLERRLGA